MVVGCGGATATTTTNSPHPSASATAPVTGSLPSSPAVAVAAAVGPSVVNVRVTGVSVSPYSGSEPYEGVGSGIIYSSAGYIITCEHVVSENGTPAQTVTVTFSSGQEVPAKIVATDSFADVAVIKVDKTGLPVATFGSVSSVQIGEYAVAIGSPETYQNSVTMGIISGLDRTIPGSGSTALVNLIQTDTPISPGNSGGALLDEQGRVIGMAEAYLPPGETGAEDIAFAIPADTVLSVAKQLIATGHASHAYLGLGLETVTATLQKQDNLSRSSGALVATVDASGPAGKAGVKQGDIITSLDGKPVTQEEDVIGILDQKNVGDTVPLVVDRSGKSLTFKVTLAKRPASASG
jgi:S1-C subfamily serine protease